MVRERITQNQNLFCRNFSRPSMLIAAIASLAEKVVSADPVLMHQPLDIRLRAARLLQSEIIREYSFVKQQRFD
jgi:hypothetical protein